MPAQRIAIYGKGGIGKSTVATNLSVLFAQAGRKVIHIGCDPKRDSSLKLIEGPPPPAVLDALAMHGDRIRPEHIVAVGRHGVEFVEAGGPEPGTGCAGRGVSVMIERLEQLRLVESGGYDLALYDVLGDVVCGGFAAPLRRGIGQRVYIVTSEEPMSMYAANNIAKAVVRYARNGISLAGLIVNLREKGDHMPKMQDFAVRLGTKVCAVFRRDRLVHRAESQFKTVVEVYPDAPVSLEFRRLADAILLSRDAPALPNPTPLSQEAFVQFVREHYREEDDDFEDVDGSEGESCVS